MEQIDGLGEKRYLLNIRQMLEDGGGDIFREATERIDSKRRQKVFSTKNARTQAAAAGAGLLIQKALADYLERIRWTDRPSELQEACLFPSPPAEQKPVLECFSTEGLLAVLGRKVTEPRYRYGKNGKPYLEDYPVQFNLSHSGDFVFCGVSEQEIGVDIQKLQGECGLRLAKRFFADSEYRELEACEDERLRRRMFFRMWVRKEAYGKLTGEGIAGAIGKSLWSGAAGNEPWWEKNLIWEEYDVPDGYRMAVCRFRQDTA